MTDSTAQLPTSGVWAIDPHSAISFRLIHHAVATFRSTFAGVSGAFDGAARSLVGEVRADAVEVPLPPLRDHLLSDDFFAAEAHPTIAFRSSEISEASGALTVHGELELRGVSHPLTATGVLRGPRHVSSPMGESERMGIDLTATIDRRRWDINLNNPIAEGVLNLGWDVTIEATLELAKPLD